MKSANYFANMSLQMPSFANTVHSAVVSSLYNLHPATVLPIWAYEWLNACTELSTEI